MYCSTKVSFRMSLNKLILHDFVFSDLPAHIISIDRDDKNIMLDACGPDRVMLPRKAELNQVDHDTLRAIDFCDATETFQQACAYDHMCSFTKTEFRNHSAACTDQIAGSFAFDCESGLFFFVNACCVWYEIIVILPM